MEKLFNGYLEIFIGSRGLLEGVNVLYFKKGGIEEYLEWESDLSKEWYREEEVDDEELEEVLGDYDWGKLENGDYYLGLGEEEIKYYVDFECERFKNWVERNNISIKYGLNYVGEEVIRELLE